MTPFELIEPETLDEALALLAGGESDVRPASGCTALMLMMKASMLKPTRLVSLRHLGQRMSQIDRHGSELRIGALCTLADVERSSIVQRELPVLARALNTLANVRVRNQAMLGGHLAHADPHLDLPPLLVALDASVVIASRHAERTIAVDQLISGYMQTTLEQGELIIGVRIPIDAERRAVYRKVTSRSADDWPALGVAVALRTSNSRIADARIVIGAAVDRPTRLTGAEALLRDVAISERSIGEAAEKAAQEAQPIADQHGSAAYKTQLIRVHVARALRQALDLPVYGA